MTRAQIKYVRSLNQKKFRRESGHFVVEGHKMVKELLSSDFVINSVYAEPGWESGRSGVSVITAKAAELGEASGLTTSPGIIAVCEQKEWVLLSPENITGTILLLDSIADPGNLGTIIRIADWFGISQVICSPDSVELYNPKTVQATMGSVFRVPVVYTELVPVIGNLKTFGFEVAGADATGMDYRLKNRTGKRAIVIGNESHGISDVVRKQIDQYYAIPGSGNAESLNAAIATAILCAHFSN